MTGQHYTATVYDPDPAVDRVDALSEALSSAGFTDVSIEEEPLLEGGSRKKVLASYPPNTDTVSITPFQEEESTAIDEFKISVIFRGNLYPDSWDSDEEYAQFVDSCIDFLREMAVRLDPTYVAIFDIRDWQSIHPEASPLAENITVPPAMAVYSRPLLVDLGGLDSLYDDVSLQREELDSGHVLVVSDKGPWSRILFEDSDDSEIPPTEITDLDLSDPFKVLDPGEYGTDAVITKSDINPEFTNEALTLERCYRDESDNLRRIEDDSFVRRVIGDDGPMGELPNDADPDEERLSALLNEFVPPAFVRMETPDDETIVSKILALDIETNKFDLLVSLAQTARVEGVDEEVLATIDGVLTELSEMDDAEGIDQYIQARLL